jgi:hypothetical protein
MSNFARFCNCKKSGRRVSAKKEREREREREWLNQSKNSNNVLAKKEVREREREGRNERKECDSAPLHRSVLSGFRCSVHPSPNCTLSVNIEKRVSHQE